MIEPRELLELYSAHFEHPKRRPDTAVSLEALQWLNLHGLFEARERLGPIEKLADLGSGLSSSFFRLWLLRGQLTPCEVWTADTDADWLARSSFECGVLLRHVPVPEEWEPTLPGQWLPLDEFDQLVTERSDLRQAFQVVFLDTAQAGRRWKLLGFCNELLVPGGCLILDDWHMEHHRVPTTEYLQAGGYVIEPHPLETLDDFGRYLAVAWKPQEGATLPRPTSED